MANKTGIIGATIEVQENDEHGGNHRDGIPRQLPSKSDGKIGGQ